MNTKPKIILVNQIYIAPGITDKKCNSNTFVELISEHYRTVRLYYKEDIYKFN